MIILQQQVTGDTSYNTNIPSGLTVFDVHNDSPYNVGVSFGINTGIQAAQYFLSPHTIIYGIIPQQSTNYTVGGSRFNGKIYVYTQTPIGGSTNFSSAPANSVTVLGYPTGAAPLNTVSLNRLQNVGNAVNTNVTTTQNTLVNDGNLANTQVVEMTVAGDGSSAVTLTNDGKLVIGNATHTGSVSFDNATIKSDGAGNFTVGTLTDNGALTVKGSSSLDNGALTTNGSGAATLNSNLTVKGTSSLDNGAIASDGAGKITSVKQINHTKSAGTGASSGGYWGQDSAGTAHALLNLLAADNDAHLYTTPANKNLKISKQDFSADIAIFNDTNGLTMQGTLGVTANSFTISGAGAQIALLQGTLSRLSTFTGTGSGTYNHGLGATPSWVGCNTNVAGSQTYGYDTANSTQVHITCGSTLGFTAFCYHS